MKKESLQWFMKCLECEFDESYWDLGGIRWKAKGDPKIRKKCPNCGKKSWHQTYKKEKENQ